MANADFTLHSTEETRSGAMACMEALRIIETSQSERSGLSMDEWWRNEDNAVAAMLHAAGNLSGFMAGFVAVFAEYAKEIHCSGVPDLDIWKPEAAMTKEEKALSRAEFDRLVEEVETPSHEDVVRINEAGELMYHMASERARKWLMNLPDSVEQYKKRASIRVLTSAKIFSENAAKNGGYYLTEESDKNLHQAIAMVGNVIIGASVGFSLADHEQDRRALVQQAFDELLDPYLRECDKGDYQQRFMTELLAPVENEAEARALAKVCGFEK